MQQLYRKLSPREMKEEQIYRSQWRESHARWTQALREEGLID